MTEIHVYGPIEDDYGNHLMWGCTWDHESWPCRTWTRLEAPRG